MDRATASLLPLLPAAFMAFMFCVHETDEKKLVESAAFLPDEFMNGSCFALVPLDGPSLSVTLSCDVLASPFPCAATTAALADFPGRLSYGTSAGGACKPCQDGLRLRLERRSGLASGYAARHARQTGLLQDAKPQQGVPTGAPSRPAHPTALLHARGASQGGIDSSSDHSSRYTPVSEGTKA